TKHLSRLLLNGTRHVAKKVDVNLEVILGICFEIMFDKWSNGSMHYVAVYGVFETEGALPDGSQDAHVRIKLFDGVLDVYNKALNMVAVDICDNSSTNQSIATKLGVSQ
ncbi:hypothetical protein JG687_00010783, partial [Phytophthora cactorum]